MKARIKCNCYCYKSYSFTKVTCKLTYLFYTIATPVQQTISIQISSLEVVFIFQSFHVFTVLTITPFTALPKCGLPFFFFKNLVKFSQFSFCLMHSNLDENPFFISSVIFKAKKVENIWEIPELREFRVNLFNNQHE